MVRSGSLRIVCYAVLIMTLSSASSVAQDRTVTFQLNDTSSRMFNAFSAADWNQGSRPQDIMYWSKRLRCGFFSPIGPLDGVHVPFFPARFLPIRHSFNHESSTVVLDYHGNFRVNLNDPNQQINEWLNKNGIFVYTYDQ